VGAGRRVGRVDPSPAVDAHAPSADEHRRGVLAGVAAYGIWGLFPLYFHHLDPASPLEVLCHRILWSLLVVAAILGRERDLAWWRTLRTSRPMLLRSAAAAALIGTNWLVYIWAVDNGNVLEAALGYFVNPLVTVMLGVVLLGERLRRIQWCAVALGGAAVVVLTAAYGRVPWVALTLALTFAGYGFLKKQIPLTAPQSLAAETALLTPLALVLLTVLEVNGNAVFGQQGVGHTALLAAAGPVTAIPLILFASSARRIPLTLLGLLQYLTPTGQFLLAVFVFHEQLSAARWVGFVLVWIALMVLSVDLVRRAPRFAGPTTRFPTIRGRQSALSAQK